MVYVFQQSVELRAKSAEYLALAEAATDQGLRKRLIELAARYFDIAQKLDVTPGGATASRGVAQMRPSSRMPAGAAAE